jgi:hypothetical protein|nr:MAG TPA: hypothetical protein [Caudoviricetes sp.]
MMDAVKFVETLGRMCDAECIKCEFRKRLSGFETCAVWRKTHPEEAVAIVEQWAAEHPAKTRQSEFLKLFPNAQTDSGCLNACPMDVFGNMGINCNKQTCYECKKKFWLTEVEDT